MQKTGYNSALSVRALISKIVCIYEKICNAHSYNSTLRERNMQVRIGRRALLLAMSLCTCHLTVAAAQSPTGEPVKVGAILSVTGPAAVFGTLERDVLQMTEKIINSRGGVKGRPIQFIFRDDGSNPDTAITHANDLIFGQKVIAILGPSISAPTVAVGGITHRNKIPQLAYAGFGPPIEAERRCVFHMPIGLELRARALLVYAKSTNVKRLGLLHDAGFGNLIQGIVHKLAPSFGVEIVATEKFEFGATDITTQAAKIKASNPEAVAIVAASAAPFRDVRRLQMSQPIIADMASANYEYVNAMGAAADNIVFAEFLVAEDPLPHQREFVDLYRKEFNRMPKAVEAFTWDSAQILMQAVNTVGVDADSEKICQAIREKPYQGVFATYNFAAPDTNGVTITSFVFGKLVNGKYTRLPFRASE